MPAPIPHSRRRTRRTLEFGGWAGGLTAGKRASPKGSPVLKRIREKAIDPRTISKRNYIGIDPLAEPSVEKIKDATGRTRTRIEWRPGSYTTFPYPIRSQSVDDINFHMINDHQLNETNIPHIARELYRILRPGGRIYFTSDNRLAEEAPVGRYTPPTRRLYELLVQFYHLKLFRARGVALDPMVEGWSRPGKEPTIKVKAVSDFQKDYYSDRRGFRFPTMARRIENKLTNTTGNPELFAILQKRKNRTNTNH